MSMGTSKTKRPIGIDSFQMVKKSDAGQLKDPLTNYQYSKRWEALLFDSKQEDYKGDPPSYPIGEVCCRNAKNLRARRLKIILGTTLFLTVSLLCIGYVLFFSGPINRKLYSGPGAKAIVPPQAPSTAIPPPPQNTANHQNNQPKASNSNTPSSGSSNSSSQYPKLGSSIPKAVYPRSFGGGGGSSSSGGGGASTSNGGLQVSSSLKAPVNSDKEEEGGGGTTSKIGEDPCKEKFPNWDMTPILPGIGVSDNSKYEECLVKFGFRIPDQVDLDTIKFTKRPLPKLSVHSYTSYGQFCLLSSSCQTMEDPVVTTGLPLIIVIASVEMTSYNINGELRKVGGTISNTWMLKDPYDLTEKQLGIFTRCAKLGLAVNLGLHRKSKVSDPPDSDIYNLNPGFTLVEKGLLDKFLRLKCYLFHDLTNDAAQTSFFAPEMAHFKEKVRGGDSDQLAVDQSIESWIGSIIDSPILITPPPLKREAEAEKLCSNQGLHINEKCYCYLGFDGPSCDQMVGLQKLSRPIPKPLSIFTGPVDQKELSLASNPWSYLPFQKDFNGQLSHELVFNDNEKLSLAAIQNSSTGSYYFLGKPVYLPGVSLHFSQTFPTLLHTYQVPTGLQVNNIYSIGGKVVAVEMTNGATFPEFFARMLRKRGNGHIRAASSPRLPRSMKKLVVPPHLACSWHSASNILWVLELELELSKSD